MSQRAWHRVIRIWQPTYSFSRCDVVVKVVMVILVKIDFREMNIVSQRAWHRVT